MKKFKLWLRDEREIWQETLRFKHLNTYEYAVTQLPFLIVCGVASLTVFLSQSQPVKNFAVTTVIGLLIASLFSVRQLFWYSMNGLELHQKQASRLIESERQAAQNRLTFHIDMLCQKLKGEGFPPELVEKVFTDCTFIAQSEDPLEAFMSLQEDEEEPRKPSRWM